MFHGKTKRPIHASRRKYRGTWGGPSKGNAGFFSCFGLTTGIDFAHYGLKSDMVFKRTTTVYKLIYKLKGQVWKRVCKMACFGLK